MRTSLVCLLAGLWLLASCGSEPFKAGAFRSPEAVPLSELPATEPKLIRLDLAMKRAGEALPADSFQQFEQVLAWYKASFSEEEAQFLRVLLFEEIALPDSMPADVMYAFLRKDYWKELLDSIALVYPAGDTLLAPFQEPFRRYYHTFRDEPLPTLATYVTGYQQPGSLSMDPYLVGETNVGILYVGLGLHYFMGPDFSWYPADIPNYVRRRFTREHMVPGALLQLVARRQPPPPTGAREPLLNHAIRAGIRYYALDVLMPDAPDSIKIGYTAAQTQFAEVYVDRIWNEMLPLLYKGEQLEYRHWLDEAPYTKGLARESPPRLGAYIGWQIVRSYIRRHPETKLRDLLSVTDYDRILRESGFRP